MNKRERVVVLSMAAAIAAVIILAAVTLMVRSAREKARHGPGGGTSDSQSSANVTASPGTSSGGLQSGSGVVFEPTSPENSSDPEKTGQETVQSPPETTKDPQTAVTSGYPETADTPQTTVTPETSESQPSVTTASPPESTLAPVSIGSKTQTTTPTAVSTAPHSFVFSSRNGSLKLLANEGNMSERIYPASLTKLVTAMTAVEYAGNRTSEPVTVSSGALALVSAGSSLAGLESGMTLTLAQLIKCMLIPSGNDAAYVLADYVGGIIDPSAKTARARVNAFVSAMNGWSAANVLINSHWVNPDGFHSAGHYTCMNDLVIVVQQAMQNQAIRDAASSPGETMKLLSGGTLDLVSTNLLLDSSSSYYNSACIGVKTGYTPQAGNCIISCFEKNGTYYFIGLFGQKDPNYRFRESNALFEKYSG
ncbi:MAG: serine hydrolase [Clostridia bacterium]|nr:serine hydrolase [Clostridia bacterium]